MFVKLVFNVLFIMWSYVTCIWTHTHVYTYLVDYVYHIYLNPTFYACNFLVYYFSIFIKIKAKFPVKWGK
jgi:hypothetical protein